MDFGEMNMDNPMRDFSSMPQVLGHEVVADVVALGPEAEGVEVGDRVVLNPWLSCVPRGVSPICPACEAGDLSLCWNFTAPPIAPGIHIGTSKDASGGYADADAGAPHAAVPGSRRPVRRARGVRRPVRGVAARDHAAPTAAGRQGARVRRRRARVRCAIAILRALYPDVEVGVVARFESQGELARKLGAERGVPARAGEGDDRGGGRVVGRSAARRPRPADGVPGRDRRRLRHHLQEGDARGVGVPAQGARHAREGRRARARRRGSGRRSTSRRSAGSGRTRSGSRRSTACASTASPTTSTSRARAGSTCAGMLTHTFALDDWRAAFTALATQDESGAIKIAFDQRVMSTDCASHRST